MPPTVPTVPTVPTDRAQACLACAKVNEWGAEWLNHSTSARSMSTLFVRELLFECVLNMDVSPRGVYAANSTVHAPQ